MTENEAIPDSDATPPRPEHDPAIPDNDVTSSLAGDEPAIPDDDVTSSVTEDEPAILDSDLPSEPPRLQSTYEAIAREMAGPAPPTKTSKRSRTFVVALSLLLSFVLGLGGGVWLSGFIASRDDSPAVAEASEVQPAESAVEVSVETVDLDPAPAAEPQRPAPVEFTLPVRYGTLGPDLIEAGAIDRDKFVGVYQRSGRPLSAEQLAILETGSDSAITLNSENAYFLLNFFWALGLANQNRVLTEGAMMQYGGEDQIGRFASTGGWSIGSKAPTDLYASALLVELTPEQQARLEEVAQAVYRPCCNNATAFPDCNHGMAMLGLLELMASEDASADSMFEAAKWANAFWFPQQSQELATFFMATEGQNFDEIDGRQAVSAKYFSSSGFRGMHEWLSTNSLLEQAPSSGNSCGV